jgi:hypothetical protein
VPLTSPADPVRQLSLFGVEAVEPSPTDLAGLLAGPGQLVRMGGTARVSVRVDAAWRVHALIPELVRRGFTASWEPARPAHPAEAAEEPERVEPDRRAGQDDEQVEPGDGPPQPTDFEVRTAYSSRLSGLGRAWLDGTAKRAPARFFLSGPRLRLWAVAAGSVQPGGYLLRLGPGDGEATWNAVDAALTRAGLPGLIIDGPAYRITGRRRLARLAELVGERPRAAPAAAWPGA